MIKDIRGHQKKVGREVGRQTFCGCTVYCILSTVYCRYTVASNLLSLVGFFQSLARLVWSQLILPNSNFLKISVAEKMQESMMPATVKVPPTIAQMVVRKW